MPLTTDQPLQIVVYGTDTSGKGLVMLLLQQFLNAAELSYELTETHDVSEFIRKKLESVPAIEVDGVMYPLKQNGSFSKSLRVALGATLRTKNYGNMEKIVAAVDFSKVSSNAFMYAHRLATDLHAVTKAVHVFVPSSAELLAAIKEVDIDLEGNRRRLLDDFVSKFDIDWGSDVLQVSLIDAELRTGFPVSEILQSVEDNGAKMLVMGTTGDSGWDKRWLGSVSTELVELSPTPLLLVPESASYRGVSDIVYAYDDINLDKKVVPALVDFARDFGANIHLLHVEQPHSTPDPGYCLQQFVEAVYPAHKVQLASVPNTDVTEGILQYARDRQVDVICIAAKKRSFVEGLTVRSATNILGLHADIPVLVIH